MSRDDDQRLPAFPPKPTGEEDVLEYELVQKPVKPKTGIDFDSDEPLIEQALRTECLDRSDQTEKGKGCLASAIALGSLLLIFIVATGIFIWGWICL